MQPYIPPNIIPKRATATVVNNVATVLGHAYTNPLVTSDNLADGSYPCVIVQPALAGYPVPFIVMCVPLTNQQWFREPYNHAYIVQMLKKLCGLFYYGNTTL